MVKRPPFLSDVTQIISGASSAFGDMRLEMSNIAQSQIERALAKRGLVSREDFDAAEARIDRLSARIAELESSLEELKAAQKPKKTTRSKAKETK